MEKKRTDQKDRILEEQQAPLKNTDHAFVRVAHDGTPEMPEGSSTDEDRKKDDLRDPDRVTTIKHR